MQNLLSGKKKTTGTTSLLKINPLHSKPTTTIKHNIPLYNH